MKKDSWIALVFVIIAVVGLFAAWCNRPAAVDPPNPLVEEIRNLAAAVDKCHTPPMRISLPPPTMPRQIEWTDPAGATMRIVFDGNGHFKASFKSPNL